MLSLPPASGYPQLCVLGQNRMTSTVIEIAKTMAHFCQSFKIRCALFRLSVSSENLLSAGEVSRLRHFDRRRITVGKF